MRTATTIDGVGVRIPVGRQVIDADLTIPKGARGIIVFAHGSGSSRFSRRNRAVARTLVDGGYGTLLADLLTAEEDAMDQQTAEFRFDIALLAERVIGIVDWLQADEDLRTLPVGLFGASTGAAAALVAAAQRQRQVRAVVSRGGRPDLAGESLGSVLAPTLLIVGGRDVEVLGLSQRAKARLAGPSELRVVPGATHLFEEAGALEEVARLAREWFDAHLAHPGAVARPSNGW